MLIVTGRGSTIIKELETLIPDTEAVLRTDIHTTPPMFADKYVLCAGRVTTKNMVDVDEEAAVDTWKVNAFYPIRMCEQILAKNDKARICVVGSESVFSGGYDDAYNASKAALHRYVETKRMRTPQQQIVCVAPTIICDSGMTKQRTDIDRLAERADRHPKKRFLLANEVAQLIYFLLYVDRGYISSTVIRMNGGEHAR